MLRRTNRDGTNNKWVQVSIPLRNGSVAIVKIRHNRDCTNEYRKNTLITCWVLKNHSFHDSDIIEKLEFNNYLAFKIFKDLYRNNFKR